MLLSCFVALHSTHENVPFGQKYVSYLGSLISMKSNRSRLSIYSTCFYQSVILLTKYWARWTLRQISWGRQNGFLNIWIQKSELQLLDSIGSADKQNNFKNYWSSQEPAKRSFYLFNIRFNSKEQSAITIVMIRISKFSLRSMVSWAGFLVCVPNWLNLSIRKK